MKIVKEQGQSLANTNGFDTDSVPSTSQLQSEKAMEVDKKTKKMHRFLLFQALLMTSQAQVTYLLPSILS